MRLMRTSEVAQRPVVTMAGEDVAQIKDVVYAPDGGSSTTTAAGSSPAPSQRGWPGRRLPHWVPTP